LARGEGFAVLLGRLPIGIEGDDRVSSCAVADEAREVIEGVGELVVFVLGVALFRDAVGGFVEMPLRLPEYDHQRAIVWIHHRVTVVVSVRISTFAGVSW
jgi:hypothetical protein